MAAAETPIRFESGDVELDGRIAIPSHATRACVVCHPHPLYGGDMHSPVVVAIARALSERGIATLRFDFRGAGASGGRHGGGSDEIGDARAAIDALSDRIRDARLAIAGYSFGAYIAMKLTETDRRITAVAAVAPPFAMAGVASISPFEQPLLLLCGDADPYCPADEARAFAESRTSAKIVVVPGTDHFLAGREADVAHAVADFVARV